MQYIAQGTRHLHMLIKRIVGFFIYYAIRFGLIGGSISKINIGSGNVLLTGYCNIDLYRGADLVIDLEKRLFPFRKNSIDAAVCISAINYFTRKRGEEIIRNVHRVLKPGGVFRIGTQDLRIIAEKYVQNDANFFFQKLPNGKERFVGETIGDKFNSWFYGYAVAKGKGCKYFYDYETLALLCTKAGFTTVEKKNFAESRISGIEKIDNRPDQMFFLEAVK